MRLRRFSMPSRRSPPLHASSHSRMLGKLSGQAAAALPAAATPAIGRLPAAASSLAPVGAQSRLGSRLGFRLFLFGH